MPWSSAEQGGSVVVSYASPWLDYRQASRSFQKVLGQLIRVKGAADGRRGAHQPHCRCSPVVAAIEDPLLPPTAGSVLRRPMPYDRVLHQPCRPLLWRIPPPPPAAAMLE